MKQSFGLTMKNIYIRYVWYSSLEYTESDVWDSLVPRSDFGINIPKYSEITISEYFLESIFQIPILWILVPIRKFCPEILSNCYIVTISIIYHPCMYQILPISNQYITHTSSKLMPYFIILNLGKISKSRHPTPLEPPTLISQWSTFCIVDFLIFGVFSFKCFPRETI